MNKYGQAAIRAVEICNKIYSPREAWEIATLEIFGESTSQKKVCPKSTFLGLCEEGLVVNISGGIFTKSLENKRYALNALDYLRQLAVQPSNISAIELWINIQGAKKIRHNSQMDVVLALWNNNLIVKRLNN